MNLDIADGSWLDCAKCGAQMSMLYKAIRRRRGILRVLCWKCFQESEGLAAKFWSRVRKGSGCWEWRGGLLADGYGYFVHVSTRERRAHRVAWQITNGDIPEGIGVLHHCDNPKCVRPDHLFLGNQKVNVGDMHSKGRSFTKLKPHQVSEIKAALRSGAKRYELAQKYKVGYSTIAEIDRGKTWAEVQ